MQDSFVSFKVAAIVGICKNAGKTTILNYIVRNVSLEDKSCSQRDPRCQYGLLSTGIDGEDFDLVYNHPKPKVYLPKKTLFVCDQNTIDLAGSSASIICIAPGSQHNRRLFIAQSEQDIESEITGPASASRQIECVKKMLELGAQAVLIDGSLDRKSIVFSSDVDAIFLAIGASFGDQENTVDELKRLLILTKIKPIKCVGKTRLREFENTDRIWIKCNHRWQMTQIHSLFGAERELTSIILSSKSVQACYIPGAITEKSYSLLVALLGDHNLELIIRHPHSLKISMLKLKKLVLQYKVSCLIPFRVKQIFLNSWTAGIQQKDSYEYRDSFRKLFPDLVLTDLWEAH